MEIKNIFCIPLGISVNEDYKKTQKKFIKYSNQIKNKNKKGGSMFMINMIIKKTMII